MAVLSYCIFYLFFNFSLAFVSGYNIGMIHRCKFFFSLHKNQGFMTSWKCNKSRCRKYEDRRLAEQRMGTEHIEQQQQQKSAFDIEFPPGG